MAASTGIINKSYVSALDPMIDTREINKLLTDVYNEDELSDILISADRRIATVQPVYYTFYDDPIVKSVTVTTNTGTGTTQVTPALSAATSGYIRQGDMVMFTNNIVGWVSAVSTSSGIDTPTIKSVSGANITLGATDTLSIFSRAVGENSATGTNIRYGLTKQSNKLQKFREYSRITDIQNASTIEVNFQGKPGYVMKDHWEKRVGLKSQINAAIWGSDMSQTSYSDTNAFLVDTNTGDGGLAGNGNVQTTRGINKYCDLYGVALVNGTPGTYLKTNLDDLVQNLLNVRAPKKQLACCSTIGKTTIDTYLKNLGSSGVTSVRLVVDGKELDLEVDRLKYGGFEFNYMVVPMFDHPVTLASGTIPKNIFYLPYDNKVKVEGGGSDTQMRMRYFPRQTMYGDGITGEIHYGANSPVNPNGTGEFWGVDFTTAQGFECLAPQFLIKQKVY